MRQVDRVTLGAVILAATLTGCASQLPGVAANGSAASKPTSASPCATHAADPCASSNGVTIWLTDLDLWFYGQGNGTWTNGPSFTWHIDNESGDTLNIDQNAYNVFDRNHTEIGDSTMDLAFSNGDLYNGCPARPAVRIPPHDTVASPGPVCLAVQPNGTAAVIEFNIDSAGSIDVALPPSYGATSGKCPSTADLTSAIQNGLSAPPGSFQLSDLYCTPALITVMVVQSGSPPSPYVVSINSAGVLSSEAVSCSAMQAEGAPTDLLRHLNC